MNKQGSPGTVLFKYPREDLVINYTSQRNQNQVQDDEKGKVKKEIVKRPPLSGEDDMASNLTFSTTGIFLEKAQYFHFCSLFFFSNTKEL